MSYMFAVSYINFQGNHNFKVRNKYNDEDVSYINFQGNHNVECLAKGEVPL